MNPFNLIEKMKNVDHWSDFDLSNLKELLVLYLKDKLETDKTIYFYKRLRMIEKEIKYRKQVLILN